MDKLLNCWEIKKCGMGKNGANVESHGECPASEMKMGHSCWIVAGTYQENMPFCKDVLKKGKHCLECKVYKLYNRSNGSQALKIKEEFPTEEKLYKKIISSQKKKRLKAEIPN